MFLCKRVRSEVGVDSVGVGGGEPGGPAGGALRLVVTRPVDESTRWPCASGRACSSSLARWAARRPLGCCRPAGHSSLTAASSEGKWPRFSADRAARWFSDSIALVVQMTRRRAGGKARKAVFLSQALSHVAAVCGCSRARVGLAEGARGPSGGLLVGGGAGSGARRRRPPCGPLWATNRTGGADRGGPRRWGPWSRARSPRAASGRPAGPSQHTISTPLAPPCWPDRAHTRRPSRRPPPRPGSRSLSHVLDAVHAPRPRRCGFGRPRHPVVGADHRRGSRRGGSPGRRPPGGRRCHSMTAPAHRVGDLGDRPPAQVRADGGPPSGGGSRARSSPRRTGR